MDHVEKEGVGSRRVSRRSLLAGSAGAAGAMALAGSRRWTGAAPAVISRQGSNTEITFLHIWGTPPGQEARAKHPADQLVEAFNAKGTGVTVNARTDSTDYYEVLQKAQAEMAAGDPPALVTTPWSYIYFADQGLGITNLEDVAAAAGEDVSAILDNLKDEVIGLVTLDGKTKGVPFAFSCPVVYYNADILSEVGVDPAALLADWASFAELGETIYAATGNPIIGVGTNHDWPAQSIIQSNGGRVLDDELQPAMDKPEAVEAMATIAALNKAGLFTVVVPSENRASFVSGAMPLFMASIAALGGLRNEVTFELGTSTFPVFTGKQRTMSSGGSFLGCYARDDEQMAAAWEFLKFAVSQEGTDIWMQTGYLNSTVFEVPLLPGQEAAYTQLEEGLTRETSWPGPRGAEIQKVWSTYVERIWANDISAEEGAAEAKQEILSLIP